ncbi:hypothetical protein BG006_006882 [Podila minutissima]|uniref:F-box domain-containing protein n=1 Tax=Podila minutissima TaxID=64525 RepID=A0A9P5SU96_9FUNG|nr:hypothetical protein BG006_006882 [Podila minutissima]
MNPPSRPHSNLPPTRHSPAHNPHAQDPLRVLDIPELLGFVCVFLTPHDQLQCVLVSRQWHLLFIPYLWSNIHIRNKAQLDRFARASEHEETITTENVPLPPLARHGHHIRSIHTAFYSLLCPLLEDYVSCAGLTKLEFPANTTFTNPIPPPERDSTPTSTPKESALARLGLDNPKTNETSTRDSQAVDEYRQMLTTTTQSQSFDEAVLYRLMKKCPRLDTLVFASFPFYHDGMIIRIADRLAGLKRLDLTNPHNCQVKAQSIQYLLQHCTQGLEELKVSISPSSKAEVSPREWIKELSPLGLKKLELLGDLNGGGDMLWLPLLPNCNQLQELSLDLFDTTAQNQLAHCLQKYCPSLQNLTLSCFAGPQEEQDLVSLVQLNPATTLRKLSMKFFHGLGPLFTAALTRHLPTLESLVFEECDGISSEDIQHLLGSCPRLSMFQAMTNNGPRFSSTVYLDVEDMLSGPWACEETLESLKVIITGIPRPDQKQDQFGAPLTGLLHDVSDRDNYGCQKAVYQRLGALVNLRELWLGHDAQDLDDEDNYYPVDGQGLWRFIDPEYQFECLEFSLRSGLPLLAGLKKLQRLNLDRMMTRIGQAEVQWMVQQWPKLRMVVGLVVQGEKVSKAVQWLYSHRPDIDLPPIMGSFTATL